MQEQAQEMLSRFVSFSTANVALTGVRYAVPWSAWLELSVFIVVGVATVLAFLNGRAWDRPEGAEHAAVTMLGFQQDMATGAFVEPLTSIGRHRLFSPTPAFRTADRGFQKYICHYRPMLQRIIVTPGANTDLIDRRAQSFSDPRAFDYCEWGGVLSLPEQSLNEMVIGGEFAKLCRHNRTLAICDREQAALAVTGAPEPLTSEALISKPITMFAELSFEFGAVLLFRPIIGMRVY